MLQLSTDYLNVSPLISGNTVNVVVSSDTEERNYSNNGAQVLIQPTDDSPFALNRQEMQLPVEGAEQLTVPFIVTGTAETVTWSSSDETVATVDETGLVTGQQTGTATVTAQMGDYSAACIVNVFDTSATGISLSASAITLEVEETADITATVFPAEAAGTVTWESSDESVATVSEEGRITAVGAGKAVITATSDLVTAECSVTVNGEEKKQIAFSEIQLSENTYNYDGKEKKPVVEVKDGDRTRGCEEKSVKRKTVCQAGLLW